MTRLVLIGVGNAAAAVNDQAVANGYDTVYGTTRQPAKLDTLKQINIEPILLENPLSLETPPGETSGVFEANRTPALSGSLQSAANHRSESLNYLQSCCEGAHVVVSYPPNSSDDRILSKVACRASKIVYISSTGVYGAASGVIDENSDVEFDNPQIKPRLDAENEWRSRGAIILRAPALYGPNYGLHIMLRAGKYKIVGDGTRFSSRIHLADLSAIVFAALRLAKPGSLYVVGDDKPTSHLEVVNWLCKRLALDLPESIPVEQAHITLRANRKINATRVKSDLGVVLRYPTYVEGFSQCLETNT